MAQKNKRKKFKKFQNKPKAHTRQSRDDTSDDQLSDSELSGSGFEEVSSNHINIKMKSNSDDESEMEIEDTRKLVQQQNKKKKKSGGFQSMGLSHAVFKGIIRKGYKVPTPIQRKTIPLIMDGKDVVAMARTGSGKTAAFLIPMFEKLKTQSTTGARALILSPTRELALQTLKFAKEIGKYTGLRSAVILGGDSLEDQFAALHENVDIIIATPGRFTHVLVEMEMKLSSVEYVVFDEADRLFEMGFQEQLREILNRLPESRQTVLFSATLPKLLVEFARAGLQDPTLIRLDVDTKLSEQLKLTFLECRSEDKMSVLLYLLRTVIKPSEQTVIFAATKHHVEYINMILQEADISCSYSYSSLDQAARKIQVAKFRNKKTMVLIVTDLAARGIDIPMLDNVINYNFPAKPKLFVHRVGRVARAGRTGTAHSLIGPDEISYVFDLHLFLGRPMKIVEPGVATVDTDGLFGRVPQTVVDDEESNIRLWHQKIDFENMKKVTRNAYKHYLKSRPVSSSESNKRTKELALKEIGYHPLFALENADVEEKRSELLSSMKNFRPKNTIFEINSTTRSQASMVMKEKRNLHNKVIKAHMKKKADVKNQDKGSKGEQKSDSGVTVTIDGSTDVDIEQYFNNVVAPKRKSNTAGEIGGKRKKQVKDEENYLHYKPKDFDSEKGYSLATSFEKEAANAVMDLTGDEDQKMRKINNAKKWDRKRKRFVGTGGQDSKKKKVKTESGTWIPASYKSNAYKDWLNRSKASSRDLADDGTDDSDDDGHCRKTQAKKPGRFEVVGGPKQFRGYKKGYRGESKKTLRARELAEFSRGKKRNEIKRPEQILKERRKREKLKALQTYRQKAKDKRRNFAKQKKGR